MTLGQLSHLRSRYEAGEPLEALSAEAACSDNALQQRWSRLALTGRVVPRAGGHLRRAREAAGLSQARAAQRVGVSERTWRRAELGEVLPAPGQVAAWIDACS